MSIEGVVFGLFMIAVVALLIALPLFSRPQTDQLADKQRERLQLYYERVLRNLRDLDEDHALGKIEDDAYGAERALWVDRGVQVLKALDVPAERAMIAPTPADDVAVDRAIDDAIEAAIQRYRAENKVVE
ncbi:MAG: hypothetical protein IPO91_25860 [Chloroflexi bacterium]|nr:hypothetical protein [Chloroflexota bacterium]